MNSDLHNLGTGEKMMKLLTWIKDCLNKLFSKRAPAPVKIDLQESTTPKVKRTYNKQKRQDFNDLLEHLDSTFEQVKLPTMSESWLERDSIVGLKKLGVHVPNPWELKWTKNKDEIKLDVSKPLPAIMCVSTCMAEGSTDSDGTKWLNPQIMFAIKHKKLPWNVSYQPGVPYLFGLAFTVDGKLFWMHMYVTVSRKTGAILICDELRAIQNVIPMKSSASKRATGRTQVITRTTWMSPSLLEEESRTIQESKIGALNLMRSMHDWWVGRDVRWNIVVKKNADRITFGIDDKETPFYFRNRDKTVTEGGVTKRIVHYVKEHERVVDTKTTTVKEHIRGLRMFDWMGYHCKVISPRLEQKTSAAFTAAGHEVEEDKTDTVYLSKLGKMLADAEERKFA